MIKAIIFDWNGTLLADSRACWEADNEVIKAAGGKVISFKRFQKTFSVPVIDFYIKNGCEAKKITKESEKYAKIFHTFYEERAKKCRTRIGVKRLLTILKKKNIRTVILSNHTVEGITNQLNRLKITDYIDDLFANTILDKAMHKQNKSEKMKNFLKVNGYKNHEAIIIGDTPEEVEMGRSAGIKSIAIDGGYNDSTLLKKARPDFLIHNMSEVESIIKKLS